MNENQAPIKAGEIHKVEVKSVGEKGDGIVRINGFVVFVPNTKKRDYVKIKITKVLPKVGFGEVIEKLEKPQRKSKYATFTKDELQSMPEEPQDQYEDTEDFGEDLDDEE